MELTINGKKAELNFGVKFVRELDKVAGMDVQGASFGMGLTKSIPALRACDPAALSDILYCATVTMRSNRPSRDAFDDYIDGCKDLEKLFDETLAEMKEANAIKVALKNAQA